MQVFFFLTIFKHSDISYIHTYPASQYSSPFIPHPSSSVFYLPLALVVNVTDAGVNKLNTNPLQQSCLSDMRKSKMITCVCVCVCVSAGVHVPLRVYIVKLGN